VSVRLGRRCVLDGVSFESMEGEVVEVRGVNGSGKTTLCRVVAGVVRPCRGRRVGPSGVRYVPGVVEPARFVAGRWAELVAGGEAWRSGLDALGFDGRLDRSLRELSFGNFRKLLLSIALTSPELLIVIDETRAGLDDAGLDGLTALSVAARERGALVILADQQVAGFIDESRRLVISAGSLEIFGDRHDVTTVTLSGPKQQWRSLLGAAERFGYRPVGDGDV